MVKKTLITIAIIGTALAAPGAAFAETVCTQEYGQAVVCHEEQVLGVTHEPVEAGILDNPIALSVGLLSVSFGFTYLSRKVKPSKLLIK